MRLQRAMVLNVYGFTSKVSALQFEWAWQKPKNALKVREVINKKPGIGKGFVLSDKIRVLWEMCSIPPWCNQPLRINILPEYEDLVNEVCVKRSCEIPLTAEQFHRRKGYVWPTLPNHLHIEYREMKDLLIGSIRE
jgi:hypothetical protein